MLGKLLALLLLAASTAGAANWHEVWARLLPSGATAEWTPPQYSMLWTDFSESYKATNAANSSYSNMWIFVDRLNTSQALPQDRDLKLGVTIAALAKPTNVLASGNVVMTTTNVNLYGLRAPINSASGLVSSNSPSAPYSVAWWVYNENAQATRTYYHRGLGANNRPLLDRASSKLRFVCGSVANAPDNYDVPTNQWVHLCITCTTGYIWNVYADNVLKITTTQTVTFGNTDINAFNQQIGGGFANLGMLDDIVISTNVFTADERNSMYNRGAPDTRAK